MISHCISKLFCICRNQTNEVTSLGCDLVSHCSFRFNHTNAFEVFPLWFLFQSINWICNQIMPLFNSAVPFFKRDMLIAFYFLKISSHRLSRYKLTFSCKVPYVLQNQVYVLLSGQSPKKWGILSGAYCLNRAWWVLRRGLAGRSGRSTQLGYCVKRLILQPIAQCDICKFCGCVRDRLVFM